MSNEVSAVKDGSIDRMNMLLSAAHLLNCEANSLVEEASDIMQERGLLLGQLKKMHHCCPVKIPKAIIVYYRTALLG